jgi:hypothetical protein
VGQEGLEPSANGLRVRCSTIELLAQLRGCFRYQIRWAIVQSPCLGTDDLEREALVGKQEGADRPQRNSQRYAEGLVARTSKPLLPGTSKIVPAG